MIFLDVEAVKALHHQQIDRFGGAPGLRDEGLLQSAVFRTEFKAQYDATASVATLAATLAWGLIRNHAFIDGNKRIGLTCLVVFLELNGYDLRATEDEQVRIVLQAASGEIDEDQWTAWILAHTGPH